MHLHPLPFSIVDLFGGATLMVVFHERLQFVFVSLRRFRSPRSFALAGSHATDRAPVEVRCTLVPCDMWQVMCAHGVIGRMVVVV
jgi:hypothetical protein